MFIPRHFKVTDLTEIIDFIQANSFGTIVSTHQGKPLATHIPFQLRQQGGDYYLTSHMAYANPQWKTLEESPNNVLVMFQGPHAYISSSWYEIEEVPTWNYQSVHIYGTASLMSKEELEEDLNLLLQQYETGRENAALWENLSSQTMKQIRGIVGFKVKVEEVQAAYKLSQNRSETDYEHIIIKLDEEPDLNAKLVAKAMIKNNPRGS